jgi:hypothetical protein
MSEDPERNADDAGPEGDLPDDVRAQLRPAAESLKEHFGGDVELAEQAILASVIELTQDATVFQYASVLAARRARQRLRDTQNPE